MPNANGGAEEVAWIKKISTEDLQEAVHLAQTDPEFRKTSDPESRKLLDAETRYMLGLAFDASVTDKQREFAALAFSGGGIRSATFCLGVAQALAGADLFKHFRYLSTVSGGGFIGSALTWWLGPGNPKKDGKTLFDRHGNFPYGPVGAAPAGADAPKGTLLASHLMHYLRQHGNYLTPEGGKSTVTIVAAALRSMLLNGLVWFPLLVALYYGVLALLLACVPGFSDNPIAGSAKLIYPAAGLAGVFLVSCAGYSLMTRFDGGRSWNYVLRRSFELSSGFLLLVAAILLIAPSPPLVAFLLNNAIKDSGGAIPAVTAVVSVAMGAVSALRVFDKTRKDGGGIPTGLLATIGAALFLYGVLLAAQLTGAYLYAWATPAGSADANPFGFDYLGSTGDQPKPLGNLWAWLDGGAPGGVGWLIPLVLAAWGLILGVVVNLNYLNLHRFYRDRLLEAFMPARKHIPSQRTGAAIEANKQQLHSCLPVHAPGRLLEQPYPLINTNIVLVRSRDLVRRNRGGDSFLLSPLFCGSNATGWQSTKNFNRGHLTLPSAMAISGAALNPNTGVGGVGMTRSFFVSLLLAWLNLRMGYWVNRPTEKGFAWTAPNHFIPGLYDLGLGGYTEKSGFLQLSDGGHFENLALYELVRRRAKLVLLCDGAADSGYLFEDLHNALRRIKEDFGATVVFAPDELPSQLAFAPGESWLEDKDLPERGYVVGTIVYAGGETGTLIYVKPTMIKGLSPAIRQYQRTHKAFPDEPTADQWFDPDQFEAYRELGYAIAKNLLEVSTPEGPRPSQRAMLIEKHS